MKTEEHAKSLEQLATPTHRTTYDGKPALTIRPNYDLEDAIAITDQLMK